MIIGNQIRIARFALRWTVQDLSERTGVTVRTVKRIEAEDGVPHASAQTLQTLQSALEAAGIKFIGTPDNDPGIRILTTKPNETS